MIVEERTYTLHPGKLAAFMRIVEEVGLPVLRPGLGNLIGYFHTETGTLNQVVHLWAYESMADREARRTALAKTKAFQDYAAQVTPLVQKMENRILVPAPFNTLPLMEVPGG